MTIWSILLPFGLFYGHLVYFAVILVHIANFGNLYKEQSGNLDVQPRSD
jgi:hypothetical protein